MSLGGREFLQDALSNFLPESIMATPKNPYSADNLRGRHITEENAKEFGIAPIGEDFYRLDRLCLEVSEMASRMAISIKHWDMRKFLLEEGRLLEKKEIPKRFHDWLKEDLANNLHKHTKGISSEFKDRLELLEDVFKSHQKQALEDMIETETANARDFYQAYTNSIRDLVFKQRTLRQDFKYRTPTEIAKIIEKALEENPVTLTKINESGTMEFELIPEVVLVERNKDAGIDLSLSFGRFSISIGLMGYFTADPIENNRFYKNIFHPHISSDRKICLGSEYEKCINLMYDFNLSEVLKTIILVLTSYNPGNPYMSLYSFHQAELYEREKKNRGNLTPEEISFLTQSGSSRPTRLSDLFDTVTNGPPITPNRSGMEEQLQSLSPTTLTEQLSVLTDQAMELGDRMVASPEGQRDVLRVQLYEIESRMHRVRQQLDQVNQMMQPPVWSTVSLTERRLGSAQAFAANRQAETATTGAADQWISYQDVNSHGWNQLEVRAAAIGNAGPVTFQAANPIGVDEGSYDDEDIPY